jgi:hypothetical protein
MAGVPRRQWAIFPSFPHALVMQALETMLHPKAQIYDEERRNGGEASSERENDV